jgi:hypothetical protein
MLNIFQNRKQDLPFYGYEADQNITLQTISAYSNRLSSGCAHELLHRTKH